MEHPSEVNNSTRTGVRGSGLAEDSGARATIPLVDPKKARVRTSKLFMASLYIGCAARAEVTAGNYVRETRNFCEAGDSKDTSPKNRKVGQEEFVYE